MLRIRLSLAAICLILVLQTSTIFAQTRPSPGDGGASSAPVFPVVEWDRRTEVSRRLGAHNNSLLGDAIDPHLGSLSFQHTDVSLPGNSDLAVSLVRELSQGYFHGFSENVEFGDWNYVVPRLSVVTVKGTSAPNNWRGQRCTSPTSTFKPVLYNPAGTPTLGNTAFPTEYSNGLMLSAPGHGSQHVLIKSPNRVQPFPSQSKFVTAAGWYLICGSASDGGEGFVGVAPNGDRYRFDRYILRDYGNLGTITTSGELTSGSVLTTRVQAMLMATQVTDVHGNWVRYDYDSAGRLTRIYSNDGRTITLQYSGGEKTVSSVTANGRTWFYDYTPSIVNHMYSADYATNKSILSKVTLPDATHWSFDTLVMHKRPATGRHCTNSGGVVSVKHPNGTRGDFVIAETRHRFGIAEWETVITNRCLGTPGYTPREPTYYDVYNRPQRTMAVQSKTLSALDIPSAVWTYTYESDIEEERYPAGHSLAGHPMPTSGNDPTNWTKVANPDGSETTYYHYWTNLVGTSVNDAISGKLVRQEERSTPSGNLLETLNYQYVSTSFFGGSYVPTNYPYASTRPIIMPHSAARNVQLASIVRERDADIYTTEYEYNIDQASSTYSYGKPTEVRSYSNVSTAPRLKTFTYTHNTAHWILGLTSTMTVNGRLIDSYEYLSNGKLHRHYRYGQQVAEYNYYTSGDEAGTPKTIRDGLSRTTQLLNWKRGVPQQLQRADGTSVYQYVDNNGWMTSAKDARGNTSEFNYDAMGRLTRINYPSPWQSTFITYDLSGPGAVQTITQGSDLTQVTYDSMFRPKRELARALDTGWSSYVNRSYDAMGRLVFQSNPSSNQAESNGIEYTYDGLSRITRERETVAPYAETRHSYLNSHRHRIYDPQNFYVDYYSYGYDGPGNRDYREIRHSTGVRTELIKNIWGELTRVRQRGSQNGFTVDQSHDYFYDAQRRVCRYHVPELGATHYQYDAAGQLTAYASGQANSGCSVGNSNTRVNLSYDAMGRLTNTNYVDSATPNIQRTYDVDGNLLTIARTGVVWNYTYNNLDLLTSEQLTVDGRQYGLSYQYNNAGHLTQRTLPSGRVVQYSLDGLGRQQGVQVDGQTFLSQVSYHPSGQLTAMRYGNGQQFTKTLNARLLPASIHSATGSQVALHQSFSYDARGNVTGINDLAVAGNSRSNSYDGMNRLVSASGPWGSGSYVYDALGNLRKKTLGARSVTSSYDGQNRLTRSVDSGWSGARNFSYDSRGNVIAAGQLQFTYDRSEQPVAISGTANGIGSASGSYRYDGHLKRVKQQVNGRTIYSVYDRSGALVHLDAVTAGEQTDYIAGPQGTLARIKNNVATYLHHDILGSAQSGTNLSGVVQWREQYSPFGEELQGISANTDQAGYTGHIRDAATGLSYMQARYYDPVIGRFYSNDPVDAMEAIRRGQPVHGFNRYAYVNNNPYKYTDPNGEWLQAIYGAISGAAGGYVSSGEGFVNTAVGMVSGALAGGAVGLANPFASHTAGMIAGGMVASAAGQVTASATTTVLDKGISNVTASDIKEGIKVDAVTTVAGGLGAGGGGLVAKGIANSTMKPIIGTTPISQAGAPHAAGMTAGAVAEGVIIGTSEKVAPQVVEKVKEIIE